jgi:hypothetical protein
LTTRRDTESWRTKKPDQKGDDFMANLPAAPYRLPDNTPNKAPLPAFDPASANYFDMFAPQYYNLETVQALTREGGGPLLLQIERVDVEYVYNPERGEDSGEWKPVIHFMGGGPALVVNQTRAKVLMNAARSIHVGEWARAGWLEVSAGIENGQAQIVIAPNTVLQQSDGAEQPAKGMTTVDAINDELFG